MSIHDYSNLKVLKLKFFLCAVEGGTLLPYLGSALRGAFGHALKESVCIESHRDCPRCEVSETCIYTQVFETPATPGMSLPHGQRKPPHPFIIETPPAGRLVTDPDSSPLNPYLRRHECLLAHSVQETVRQKESTGGKPLLQLDEGDEITLGITLLGRSIDYLPFIIYAVNRMSRRGLGVRRTRFNLGKVSITNPDNSVRVIFSGGALSLPPTSECGNSLQEFICNRIALFRDSSHIKLRFITPTRIRREGRLQTHLSLELLVRNLLRRMGLLFGAYASEPLITDYTSLIKMAGEVRTTSSSLIWQDWERYSSRQGTKMKLGGFTGEVEFDGGQLRTLLPLIVAGEVLHVGKATSFGHGHYRIVE